MATPSYISWHRGGCHCGAVTFEVLLPHDLTIDECNCSMCSKAGFLHVIVPKSRFRLLSGEDKITDYQFNTKTAHHLFCSVCGVKSFYVPRSHPNGYSVNFRCLDRAEFGEIKIVPFDGRHWEEHIAELAPLEDD